VSRNRLLLLLLVALLFLPGCFVIFGFGWSNYHIPRGGKAVARLKVRPAVADNTRGHFFVLVVFLDPSDGPPELKVGFPRRFDTKGKFGGPHSLVKDPELEDIVRETEPCLAFVGPILEKEVRDNRYLLLRTQTPVRSRGAIEKQALTKIGIEDRINDGSTVAFTWFYTGIWRDDDEVSGPSENDTTACMSSVESSIPIGRGAVATEAGGLIGLME